MANKEELKQSFVEVRKAYRLLYEYQKKILDLMSFIQAYFGLTPKGWWQKFSKKLPKEPKITLNMWAWDWLPMYFSNFGFHKNDLRISILLVSDSGYFENDENISFGNYQKKLNLNKFKDVEESTTKLIFIVEKKERKFFPKTNNWYYPKFFKKGITEEKEDGGLYKICNLDDFHNQQSTEKILEKLSEFAIKNEFELKKSELQ